MKYGSRQMNKESKDFLEWNENEYIAYPNLWKTMKTVLTDEFVVLSAYIKIL